MRGPGRAKKGCVRDRVGVMIRMGLEVSVLGSSMWLVVGNCMYFLL